MAADTRDSTNDMWSRKDADGQWRAGWALLPLRLFLGVTFLFAGLQKLSNPQFLSVSSPGGLHAQLVAATHTSPIGSLLAHFVSISTGLGVIIALGEVAIGIGALVGFLTRIAAVGGLLLSFSLFLAISFHTSPYYEGSDIVFFFAWIPLVLAGAGGAPALDTWLALRTGTQPAEEDASLSRRVLVTTGVVAVGAGLVSVATAAIGRSVGGTKTTAAVAPSSTITTTTATSGGGSTSTTTGSTPKGTVIGAVADVPVGGSASFNAPSNGDPAIVLQPSSDTFVAFDAVCPHEGCTVAYQPASQIIACPCHGSQFNATTGAVLQGPAQTGLTPIKVIAGTNGKLYAV